MPKWLRNLWLFIVATPIVVVPKEVGEFSMEPSPVIVAFLKDYEKFVSKAYMPTPNDVPTIGYGHTKGVDLGDRINKKMADAYFQDDLNDVTKPLNKALKGVELKQHEYDAVVSLVFNIGIGAFKKSKAFESLKVGDHDKFLVEAFNYKIGFVKQGKTVLAGLVNRRGDEENIFTKGVYKRT